MVTADYTGLLHNHTGVFHGVRWSTPSVGRFFTVFSTNWGVIWVKPTWMLMVRQQKDDAILKEYLTKFGVSSILQYTGSMNKKCLPFTVP